MREIKFRAWDTVNKVWRDIEEFIVGKNDAVVAIKDTNGNIYQVHEGQIVLMQNTGLHDKNGKEIYEGDVMRILYTDWPSQTAEKNGRYSMSLEEYKKSISSIGFVQWENDRWVINFGKGRFGDDETGRMDAGPHGEKEIIGNIYENPELIEK